MNIYKSLAPMDGVTDFPFRSIVRKYNPEVYLYSEFTHALKIKEKLNSRLLIAQDAQRSIAQIFGNDPKQFQDIQLLEDAGCIGVDINMGCPSKKIANSQHGSGLMRNPDLACKIVETCAKQLKIPVSVKTRLGWENHHHLIEFIQRLINSGVSLVIIHGRTYQQKFKGEANWEPIYELKKNVVIPIIGNGDVIDHEDGMKKLKNLDGYMIGRSSYGKPWIFWDLVQKKQLNLKMRLTMLMEHYQLCRSFYNENLSLINIRKHLKGYLFGYNRADEVRTELMQCKNAREFTHCLSSIAS